ncbi:MAG: Rha family transcriptional regulator, partial [Clostridia bacterium]|nr:Rha family transcriptional regulator [Clostridia bacterium]
KNNRQRPCYNVTKKGCEFIAHKLTGVKGAAFTARYINKFHDMEDVIDGKRIMSKKEALNRKKNNWYGRNNEKIENILLSSGWGKKYLYHRILTEVSDVWDSNYLKAMYKSKNGYYPRYAMDIIDTFQEVRDVADAYIDFLYNKFYIDEDYLIEEFEEEF